ncbi:MAG: gamma carbonic anhydrase family protein [Rhodocyclaceae bacterium]|nr:gamma carbonic anhydrase family protein [Rhodocyclaceae bacterium]
MSIYTIGDVAPQFLGDYWIAPTAAVMGSVILHNNVSVWFGAVIRGDHDPIEIGEGSNIQDGSVVHTDAGLPMQIGANVTVGHQVMLHGCSIGDGSLIGIKSVIMNRAKIGKNCLIGANSLVPENKVIPDRMLALGTPVRIIRELTDAEVAGLYQSAASYVQNALHFKQHLARIPG